MIRPAAHRDPVVREGTIAHDDPLALTVLLDSFDGDQLQRQEHGPCRWSPRGHLTPRRGDRCLVVDSEIVIWWDGGVPGPPVDWSVPLVDELPDDPVDGETVDFLADEGVVWRLRYRAASRSAYKWEGVGGSPLISQSLADTSASLAASTWAGIDADDPRVTVPLAGDFDVDSVTGMSCDTTLTLAMGVRVGMSEPVVGTNAIYAYLALGTASLSLTQARRITGVAASTTLQQRYWHNGGSARTVGRRSSVLRVRPVRVSG